GGAASLCQDVGRRGLRASRLGRRGGFRSSTGGGEDVGGRSLRTGGLCSGRGAGGFGFVLHPRHFERRQLLLASRCSGGRLRSSGSGGSFGFGLRLRLFGRLVDDRERAQIDVEPTDVEVVVDELDQG